MHIINNTICKFDNLWKTSTENSLLCYLYGWPLHLFFRAFHIRVHTLFSWSLTLFIVTRDSQWNILGVISLNLQTNISLNYTNHPTVFVSVILHACWITEFYPLLWKLLLKPLEMPLWMLKFYLIIRVIWCARSAPCSKILSWNENGT